MADFELLRDSNGGLSQIVELTSCVDLDGTAQSVASDALQCELIRIVAIDADIRFLIGAAPTALATSHLLQQGKEIYQPITRGYKIAVLGGKAHIGIVG